MDNLDTRAEQMEEGVTEFSKHDHMIYGHTRTSDGRFNSLVSISDACFHTGQALASECFKLEYWYKISKSSNHYNTAITRIEDMILGLHKQQLALGEGQLGRLFTNNPIAGIPEWTKRPEGHYTWRQMTWDQYIPIFYGLHHVNKLKHHLSEPTIARLKVIAQGLGNHFLKHSGFIGEQTNIRAHPWYKGWSFQPLFKRGGHQSFKNDWVDKLVHFLDKYVVLGINYVSLRWLSPFKKHITYKACVLNVCADITGDPKLVEAYVKHVEKFENDLIEMGKPQKDIVDRWYVRMFMKTMYKVKTHKWKFWNYFKSVPAEISQDHLESTIGPHLRFMSLIPLANQYEIFLPILTQEMEKIKNKKHPWFIAQYYNVSCNSKLLQDYKLDELIFKNEMQNYRGPRMYTSDGTTVNGWKSYLTYLGNVKTMHDNALSSNEYIQHWSWAQSKVYESGSWFGKDSNYYDDYVGWLAPYWIGKNNGWL